MGRNLSFVSERAFRFGSALVFGLGLLVTAAPVAGAQAEVPAASPSNGEVHVMGGKSVRCTGSQGDEDIWCFLEVQNFPGGTVSVDVDAGGADRAYREWTLRANFAPVCKASYSSIDPPRSWVCHNVPAGTLNLKASKYATQWIDLGLRW